MSTKIILKKEYQNRIVPFMIRGKGFDPFLHELPKIDLKIIFADNEPEIFQWFDKENIEYYINVELEQKLRYIINPMTFEPIRNSYIKFSVIIQNDKDAMRFKLIWM
jgi:hypothetical protein